MRDRLRAFWNAHRKESQTERYRRLLDDRFADLDKPDLSRDRKESLLNALSGALGLAGRFRHTPAIYLDRKNPRALDRAIADWQSFWKRSRTLPRSRLARAVIDQQVRWLRPGDPFAYRRVSSIAGLLRQHLSRETVQRLIAARGAIALQAEAELLGWWKANRRRFFNQLPPWYDAHPR